MASDGPPSRRSFGQGTLYVEPMRGCGSSVWGLQSEETLFGRVVWPDTANRPAHQSRISYRRVARGKAVGVLVCVPLFQVAPVALRAAQGRPQARCGMTMKIGPDARETGRRGARKVFRAWLVWSTTGKQARCGGGGPRDSPACDRRGCSTVLHRAAAGPTEQRPPFTGEPAPLDSTCRACPPILPPGVGAANVQRTGSAAPLFSPPRPHLCLCTDLPSRSAHRLCI